MEECTSFREFNKVAPIDLLDVEMQFNSMDNGTMHYFGVYKKQKVYCSISEVAVNDYDYSNVECINSLSQAYYVYLTLNDNCILNIG